jgi:6,7-dimethyl-8-ribityllumazine synthase
MNNKILIVASNYYKDVSNNLILGSSNFLEENNYQFDIINAPGCFEIPFIIKKNINNYLGFVTLGCVIRGETYHFELISNECVRKIMDLSVDFSKPIGLGILTCDNYNQAIIRSDPLKKNKGKEAALACIHLLNEI